MKFTMYFTMYFTAIAGNTMNHTVSSIASELGVTTRAVKNWLSAAKAGEYGELGRIVDGKRS